MSDYLGQLVAGASVNAAPVRPKLFSLFEPIPASGGLHAGRIFESTDQPEQPDMGDAHTMEQTDAPPPSTVQRLTVSEPLRNEITTSAETSDRSAPTRRMPDAKLAESQTASFLRSPSFIASRAAIAPEMAPVPAPVTAVAEHQTNALFHPPNESSHPIPADRSLGSLPVREAPPALTVATPREPHAPGVSPVESQNGVAPRPCREDSDIKDILVSPTPATRIPQEPVLAPPPTSVTAVTNHPNSALFHSRNPSPRPTPADPSLGSSLTREAPPATAVAPREPISAPKPAPIESASTSVTAMIDHPKSTLFHPRNENQRPTPAKPSLGASPAREAPPALVATPREPRAPQSLRPVQPSFVAPTPRIAAVKSDRGTESAAPPPAIHVTIGRLEIRAVSPPAEKARPRPAPSPVLSLEDYLRRRITGGAR